MRNLAGAAASCAAILGGLGAGPMSALPARVATAGACFVQGSLFLEPAWTPPYQSEQSESMSFGGTASCAGLVGGTLPLDETGFSGSLQCSAGSMEAAVCTLALAMGPLACSNGTAVQVGLLMSLSCTADDGSGPVPVEADVALTPNPINQGTDIQTLNFTGAAVAGGE